MKTLTIEWQHLDVEGRTCDRCHKTGQALEHVVDKLKQQGIAVTFHEKKLSSDEVAESNQILINGLPLERLLPQAAMTPTTCTSCRDIVGVSTSCRATKCGNRTYEAIPATLIQKALDTVLGFPPTKFS